MATRRSSGENDVSPLDAASLVFSGEQLALLTQELHDLGEAEPNRASKKRLSVELNRLQQEAVLQQGESWLQALPPPLLRPIVERAWDILRALLGDEPDLRSLDLHDLQLAWHDFSDCDLRQANLAGADLTTANLSNTLLCETNLAGSRLHKASLSNALLFKANVQGADLSGAAMQHALVSGSNLTNANLQGAELSFGYLAPFRGWRRRLGSATLKAPDLWKANLKMARLDGAVCRHALLQQANLRGASFVGADLTGAVLEEAEMFGANLQRAKLQNAQFRNTNLRGAQLAGADLTGAKDLTAYQVVVADGWRLARFDEALAKHLNKIAG